jgi:hypothetical protein
MLNDPSGISPSLRGRMRHGGSQSQRTIARHWPRWLELCGRVARGEQLTAAELVEISSMMVTLEQLGVNFDRDFIDHLMKLRAAAGVGQGFPVFRADK